MFYYPATQGPLTNPWTRGGSQPSAWQDIDCDIDSQPQRRYRNLYFVLNYDYTLSITGGGTIAAYVWVYTPSSGNGFKVIEQIGNGSQSDTDVDYIHRLYTDNVLGFTPDNVAVSGGANRFDKLQVQLDVATGGGSITWTINNWRIVWSTGGGIIGA